jgi:long-chain fatty acid transport protein
LFLALIGVLVSAQLSFGAGFALYEGSARGVALGGTLVGRADDPSALFYNPAGITQLPGLQVQAGATAIIPGTKVTTDFGLPGTEETEETKTNVWVPPHLYATYQFSDRVWFGVGTFSQFGLGTEFDANWRGRFNSYEAVIQTVTLNPNVAFKVTDEFSLAAGLDVMWFDLTLKNRIPLGVPFASPEEDHALEGDSFGYGFNFAMHYQPCRWAKLGASYRSQVKQNVQGTAEFSGAAPPGVFTNTDVSGSILLPDMVFFGVALYPIERLSLEVGGVWNRWSNFDELRIDYETPIPGAPNTIVRNKSWHDTWRIQFGAEYKALDWLDLRAGYVFDEEPISDDHADYLVPAADRHIFSFGPGFRWNNWTLDLAYGYIHIEDREFTATPTQLAQGVLNSKFHDGNAHLISMSVGYKF